MTAYEYKKTWRAKNKARDQATRKRWRARNTERIREQYQQWRKRNPDKVKRHARRVSLRRRYGITEAQYDALLESQGGGCAICGSPVANKAGHQLYVDHNHQTNRVRGILCQQCNSVLAYARESVQNLLRAAAYLRAHGS